MAQEKIVIFEELTDDDEKEYYTKILNAHGHPTFCAHCRVELGTDDTYNYNFDWSCGFLCDDCWDRNIEKLYSESENYIEPKEKIIC